MGSVLGVKSAHLARTPPYKCYDGLARLVNIPDLAGELVVEDPIDRLEAAVRRHYELPDAQPLLLSRFGQLNKELLSELKAEFGSLANAVRAAGENRIRVVDSRPGQEAIAPAAIADHVALRVKEQSASQQYNSSKFDGLPKSVQIAFCVRTEVGQHVAIRVSPPFKYDVVLSPDLLRPNFRILADKYRKAGLALRNASPQDKEELWSAFLAWADEQKVDTAVFSRGSESNALFRLLAAQDPDLLGRLVIPADIAQLLVRRP